MAHPSRRKTYRPTPSDFFCEGKKLSLKEGGQHDREYWGRMVKGENNTLHYTRIPATRWEVVCRDHQRRGISRKARISRKAA